MEQIILRGTDEFTVRVLPYPEGVSSDSDRPMEADGWHRAWASSSVDGVLVVYCRHQLRSR